MHTYIDPIDTFCPVTDAHEFQSVSIHDGIHRESRHLVVSINGHLVRHTYAQRWLHLRDDAFLTVKHDGFNGCISHELMDPFRIA